MQAARTVAQRLHHRVPAIEDRGPVARGLPPGRGGRTMTRATASTRAGPEAGPGSRRPILRRAGTGWVPVVAAVRHRTAFRKRGIGTAFSLDPFGSAQERLTNRPASTASSRIRKDRQGCSHLPRAGIRTQGMWKTSPYSFYSMFTIVGSALGSPYRTGAAGLGRLSRRVFQRVSSAGYMRWQIHPSWQEVDADSRTRLCALLHGTLRVAALDSARGGCLRACKSAVSRIGFGVDSRPPRWIAGTEWRAPCVSNSASAAVGAGARMQLCAARPVWP